ncbi:MAG: hypothetical protein DHS20C11_31350 [Lysobacteraceae bacterium]|nr:MAG: hypothetical protein DHS20C11_31350 [Xanthomonadaceae bacterium]
MLLAVVEERLGDFDAARQAAQKVEEHQLQTAMELYSSARCFQAMHALMEVGARRQKIPLAWAQSLWGVGRYEQSYAAFEAEATRSSSSAEAVARFAQSAIMLGRGELALPVIDQRVEQHSGCALQGGLIWYDQDQERSAYCFRRARALEPGIWQALIGEAACQPKEQRLDRLQALAGQLPEGDRAAAMLAGHMYAAEHQAPFIGQSPLVLKAGLDSASTDGLVLECGVYFGRTLNLMAQWGVEAAHGFDCFEGLPADWNGQEASGAYSTGGYLPVVSESVQLHRGLFEHTLQGFADEHQQSQIRLLHVDCDLYTSATEVLKAFGPMLQSGSIVVHDDYCGYPGWQGDEFRAWQEFTGDAGVAYDYLGFGLLGREAAVRVRSVQS